MLDQQNYVRGTFLKELDNRFRCLVNIDGEDTVCYVASSCKLEKLIPLHGKQVLLLPTKKASLPYSVYAVKFRNSYCLLNLSQANRIVFSQIDRKLFSFLGSRKHTSMEKTISGYKSDIFIHDTNTVIEIKTVISPHPTASFSSISSDRASQQLAKLEALMKTGYHAIYLIIGLSPNISKVTIDRNSSIYPQFAKCLSKGMRVYGLSLHTKNLQFEVFRPIAIEIV